MWNLLDSRVLLNHINIAELLEKYNRTNIRIIPLAKWKEMSV